LPGLRALETQDFQVRHVTVDLPLQGVPRGGHEFNVRSARDLPE